MGVGMWQFSTGGFLYECFNIPPSGTVCVCAGVYRGVCGCSCPMRGKWVCRWDANGALMLYHNLCRNYVYRAHCSYRVLVSTYSHITDRVANAWWGQCSARKTWNANLLSVTAAQAELEDLAPGHVVYPAGHQNSLPLWHPHQKKNSQIYS